VQARGSALGSRLDRDRQFADDTGAERVGFRQHHLAGRRQRQCERFLPVIVRPERPGGLAGQPGAGQVRDVFTCRASQPAERLDELLPDRWAAAGRGRTA
jgi:hypothetical protein